mmetsp:Transcript_30665/g.61851  ORF Transcript_30665/g.61851 Transcript_30665/m.61851 type:complete len:206 (+) Transcript_30665:55-672(+)
MCFHLPPQRHARHRCHVVLLLHRRPQVLVVVPRDHRRGWGVLHAARRVCLRRDAQTGPVPPGLPVVDHRQHSAGVIAAAFGVSMERGDGHPGLALLPGRERSPLHRRVDMHHACPRPRGTTLSRGHGRHHVRSDHEHQQSRRHRRLPARRRTHHIPRSNGARPGQLLAAGAHLQPLDRPPARFHRICPRGRPRHHQGQGGGGMLP